MAAKVAKSSWSALLEPFRAHSWLRSPYLWAIVLRLALLVALPRDLQGDAMDYHNIATNVAQGHGFSRCTWGIYPPTAQRPPLYPYLLGVVYWLGGGADYSCIVMNVLLDLCSMWLVERWARALGFGWSRYMPWVVALCPLLITYAMYPTSENLSVTLFFLALVATVERRRVLGGLSWGLFALARSYMLLLPILLLVLRPFRKVTRRELAVMIALSALPPSVWVARNYRYIGKPVFSQNAGVGWQLYLGLCMPDFDWWRPDQVSAVLAVPEMDRMTRMHCQSDEEIGKLDREILELVHQCVVQHPAATVRNIFAKTYSLVVNWGQLTPYNQVPVVLAQAINAVMLLYWCCLGALLWSRRRRGKLLGFVGGAGLEDGVRFSLLALFYVLGVTLPFGVDARYLLAPFLSMFVCALEMSRGPRRLLEAGGLVS